MVVVHNMRLITHPHPGVVAFDHEGFAGVVEKFWVRRASLSGSLNGEALTGYVPGEAGAAGLLKQSVILLLHHPRFPSLARNKNLVKEQEGVVAGVVEVEEGDLSAAWARCPRRRLPTPSASPSQLQSFSSCLRIQEWS